MAHSPSWESDGSPASQKILSNSVEPQGALHVYKGPPFIRILNH